jgi:alpha-1,2-mannosidase, putative
MKKILYLLVGCFISCQWLTAGKTPVDYVNPYIGNISFLLMPTYPTVHLPNSMLRVYPERDNFTDNTIKGLPLIVTGHRGSSAFRLSPYQGDLSKATSFVRYSYGNEIITPYYYGVDLDEEDIYVQYAPSHQSAIYEFEFSQTDKPAYFIFNTRNGELKTDGKSISGYQRIGNQTQVYIYLEPDQLPIKITKLQEDNTDGSSQTTQRTGVSYVLEYSQGTSSVKIRYGVSFISAEQAEKNLRREIKHYDLQAVSDTGRRIWNETLGKVRVTGGTENEKTVFYTSLYRTCERMICISEDGRYFSAYDGKVHEDEGIPFYVDDWIWDTYRATHPLRMIIEADKESDMINSFIRMAYQMPRHWMPTFPEVNGDSRRMNSNHGVATVLDAYVKGMRSFDLAKAYEVCKAAITEKTLAPWSAKPAGVLDKFYKDHGYFPALAVGEEETVPEVHGWEKRQPIAVTLGTVYDEWCLGNIAKLLANKEDADYFLKRSLNYHTVFNTETGFFHPKDSFGNFIEPFDYRYSGGLGGREAYDENNGWIYRWDVPHNVNDLVNMMGGKKRFIEELERMYSTSLGKGRLEFYNMFPDHTGNVGQFSMGNEPAMHIPYLYNYAGEPWRTQKRVRSLLTQWFRNDLFGIPGDEDGGGLTSFVVFSMMGFYPVTPGLPMYVIGSPVFETQTIQLSNGKTFQVVCRNYSPENKFIQSVNLNGRTWNKSWFSHEDLMKGGVMEFVMGKRPNKKWAAGDDAVPPSFEMK